VRLRPLGHLSVFRSADYSGAWLGRKAVRASNLAVFLGLRLVIAGWARARYSGLSSVCVSRENEGAGMAAFRFIAWILVAIAVALLGADGVASLEQGEPIMRSTADIMMLVGIDGGAMAESAPGGVSQALGTIMGLPLWGVLGIIGVVLTLIFRPME
jgi:hypothetical protein